MSVAPTLLCPDCRRILFGTDADTPFETFLEDSALRGEFAEANAAIALRVLGPQGWDDALRGIRDRLRADARRLDREEATARKDGAA